MSQEKHRLLARKARIDARLAAIAEADAKRRAKHDQRRADLAGRAVLKCARKDQAFAATLRAILDEEITGARNRALFDLPPKGNAKPAAAPEQPPQMAAE